MHDLRLIGVQDDGQHVLLADTDGARYRLPLDEQLRAAARRDRSFLGQLPLEIDGGMRPRDIQAMIRRGLSAEEVAERAGWSVEKVRRFEGPILAEREYVAELARRSSVGSGAQTRTLGARVDERLTARGVDLDRVNWDSAREDETQWTVSVHFPAGGRERNASWRFDPRAAVTVPANDEARWLSEDDSVGPIPTPHVATTANPSSAIFDVEAVEGRNRRRPRRGPSQETDLVDAMREHSPRGRRTRKRATPEQLPVEQAPVDALPLEPLARDLDSVPPPPAARDEHPVEAHLEQVESGDQVKEPERGAAPELAEHVEDHEQVEPEAHLLETVAFTPTEDDDDRDRRDADDDDDDNVDDASAPEDSTEPDPAAEESPETVTAPERNEPTPPPALRKRSGRPSVPRWDDIMFGSGSNPSPPSA